MSIQYGRKFTYIFSIVRIRTIIVAYLDSYSAVKHVLAPYNSLQNSHL